MSYAYCNRTDYIHTADFQQTVLHAISVISVPVYVYGFYCVLLKTPPTMQSVKWSMMNVHVFSCIFDLSLSFFTTPYVLFPVLAGYPLGVLKEIGVSVEAQVYFVVLVGAYMMVAISIVFENRLFVLVMTNKMLHKFALPIYIIHYIFPTIVLPSLVKLPDQQTGKANFLLKYGCVPPYVDLERVFYLIITKRYFLITCAVFICTMFAEVWFFALVTDRLLKKQMTKTMSQKTFDLHKKFQRAFILQLLIPFIIVFLPISYIGVTCISEYHNQFFNNLTLIIISSHGFFSTIAMIALHAPYREFTQKIFPCLKRFSSSATSSTAPQSLMITNL